MSTIVTRISKGSPVTNNEADFNFINLNADKSETASNLSDMNASAARTSLGLGNMAMQDSNNVAITGGTIKGNSTLWYRQAISAVKWVM